MSISSALTVAALALSGGGTASGSPPHAGPYAPRAPGVSAATPGGAAPRAIQSASDSAAARDRARDHARRLQSRFESHRARHLPRTLGGGSPPSDETIGRLCVWDEDDDDWTPPEEPPEIVALRAELLAALDSLAREIPGDHWVLGQRIRYLVEAGRLGDAAALADRCGPPERWRCDAYLGYARHQLRDVPGAERAFRRALDAMPPGVRADWIDPEPVLGRDLRRWVADRPDSAAAIDRLWMLADPLFLAPGNDRWTMHLSRWTHTMSSEDARNPYMMRWGDDLTEVTVRYGWPVAWHRTWPMYGGTRGSVVGHDPPGGFRAFPPPEVLDWGAERVEPVVWEIPEGHARSKHLPPYLDSLGILDGQIGRFRRRGGVLVMAAWSAPRVESADSATGTPADPAEMRNRIIAGVARGAGGGPPAAPPLRAGLFVERDGALGVDVRTRVAPGGVVRLSALAPWSNWGVVSLETWSPETRRAWRLRAGMGMRHILPDLFTISDLLLLEPGAEPAGPEEVAEVLRPSTQLAGGDPLTLAFEVYGLRSPSEVADFRVWVERVDEGFVTRAVRWLGLGGERERVTIGWREGGPESRRGLFRVLSIRPPDLEPGRYEVVIEVSARGHSPVDARRSFTVR